jgi:MbtH protein
MDKTFEVVVNHEGQYSIWAAERAVPLGWRIVGKCGTREVCLSYIAEVWTDMRPLSLRESIDPTIPARK